MECAVLQMPSNSNLTVDTPSNEDSPDNTTPNKAVQRLQHYFHVTNNLCGYSRSIVIVLRG
jgi:hypothetical protein